MCTKKAVRGKVALLILAFISLGIDLLMMVVQLSNKYSFNIFGWIFWLLPTVLFLLYLFKFNQGKIASVIIAAVFAIFALLRLVEVFRIIPLLSVVAGGVSSLILNLSYFLLLGFTAVSIVMGWKSKIFIIIAAGFAFGHSCFSVGELVVFLLKNLENYIQYGITLSFVWNIVNLAGDGLFCLALFLLGVLNEVPALFPSKRKEIS